MVTPFMTLVAVFWDLAHHSGPPLDTRLPFNETYAV